jgi:hypothetical protein
VYTTTLTLLEAQPRFHGNGPFGKLRNGLFVFCPGRVAATPSKFDCATFAYVDATPVPSNSPRTRLANVNRQAAASSGSSVRIGYP